MDEKQLCQILETRNLVITPTDLGVSNENLLVQADGQEYIWRRPVAGSTSLKTSREAEQQAIRLAAGLDVPTVCYDSRTGEKLTRRVAAVPFDQCQDGDKYERAGRLLRRLHSLPALPVVFDPFEKLEDYRRQTRKPVHFPHEEQILQQARQLWAPSCLCHNDLVAGNILLSRSRDWLIDYEYAAGGDPRFDLASFFSENDITSDPLRRQFLEGYGLPVDPREVMLFELVADMIWANWAQMLLEDRHDPVFAKILGDKKRHFEKLLDKLIDIEK